MTVTSISLKPLEWRSQGIDGQTQVASAFGLEVFYRIAGKPGDWALTSPGPRAYVQTPGYGSRFAARAAAEVDRRRRILTETADASAGFSAGLRAAAAFVAKRRGAYIEEHGSYDPSTGVTEFPGEGDEYVGELEEIEEGILALPIPEAAPAVGPAPEPVAWPDPGRFTDIPSRLRRAAELIGTGKITDGQSAWIADVAEDAALKIEALERDAPASAAPAGTPMVACPNRDPLLRTAADQERG